MGLQDRRSDRQQGISVDSGIRVEGGYGGCGKQNNGFLKMSTSQPQTPVTVSPCMAEGTSQT